MTPLYSVEGESDVTSWAIIENISLDNFRQVVKMSTSIRVYKLNGKTNEIDGFPIKPYGVKSFSGILNRKVADGDNLIKLKNQLMLIGNDSYGNRAMCHMPGYGLEVYIGNDKIIETSLCGECNNFYIPIINSSSWAPIGKEGYMKNLFEILDSFFPVANNVKQK